MKAGARFYVAVAGGIEVPPSWAAVRPMGSELLGGFAGRKLAAGDVLPVGQPRPGARAGRKLAGDLAPGYPKSLELRVLTGLYFHRLTDECRQELLRGHLDGRTGGRPHRLPLPQGAAAVFPRAQAALWRGLRSVEHRRCRLSLRLDPGAGRPRADHPASRRGVGRRLRHDRHGDQRRHGPLAQMQPNNLARFVEVDMAARSKRAPSIRRGTPGCGRCCPRSCHGAVQVAAAVTDASYRRTLSRRWRQA